MNGRWMESFIAVAQCGSVNKAAQQRFISPQALLQQINLLEKSVGMKLLVRGSGGVSLTPSGREFLRGAQQMLDMYHTTINRCRLLSNAEETIRVPIMSSVVKPVFMESVCNRYIREHPGQYEIRYIHAKHSNDAWLTGLRNLEYDMIEMYTLDGLCPPDVHFEKAYSVKTWCLMSMEHPLAKKGMLQLSDLIGYVVVSSDMKLSAYVQMHAKHTALDIRFVEIEADRYQIITHCNQGSVVFMDGHTVQDFPGYAHVPLDFNTHVDCGLACRADMAEAYAPLLQIAREVGKEMEQTEAGKPD